MPLMEKEKIERVSSAATLQELALQGRISSPRVLPGVCFISAAEGCLQPVYSNGV